ncbi:response regulator transcription factor [Lachnoclostridium sp.]|uniref:response regulator transcription factor n=1 Tax=Lachnoclostridium sp. TaxID=2028282 RepID=UPI0028A13AEB|nr:response regulator transcription factor [Lachnoclostridium sp.]
MGTIRVVIADDHKMVREGLKQLLELDGDIQVVGEASDGEQCIQKIMDTNPDVLLLDINMPTMNGLQTLQELRRNNSKQKVLMLTIHNEIEYLLRAVDIGVNGYILKDSESSVLKKAIYTIYQGETYIEPSLTPELKERMQSPSSCNTEILTRREVDVLKLLAEGLFNKEIAYRLSISEKTVKNHVSNIFKKISVSDRTQAAVYAIKNNFVNMF